MTEVDTMKFLYSFFSFMFGIYPYAVITKKPKEAMDKVGINYPKYSIYEFAYMGIKKLLG